MEHIKTIRNVNEFSELINIQREAWGLADIDMVPLNILKAVSDMLGPNGIVLGYFIDEKIVGFIMTLPSSNPKEVLAHIGAVYPEYQNRGIFYKINLELHKIMRLHNVDKIFGTYDPLESINANLYIRKLGGIVTRHYVNYYGELNSKIHSGLPTDRFRIEWNLNKKEIYRDEDVRYVDIPLNIQELKNKNLNDAIEWRMKTRKLFDELIEQQKYIGVDFIVDQVNQKGKYVFKKIESTFTGLRC
jgi:predicted GNAT superfamily acetyltransferase